MIGLIKLSALMLLIYCLFDQQHHDHSAAGVVVTAQNANLGDITPNFEFCNDWDDRYKKACFMSVLHWSEARKAERAGSLIRWYEIPPASSSLGLPTYRLPTEVEKLAQKPLSLISEWYSCTSIDDCLCQLFGGIKILHIGNMICKLLADVLPPASLKHNNGPQRRRRQAGKADRTLSRCTRREYRMLSDDQRTRFHNAMLQLKRGYGSYEYDRITALHSNINMMPSAHSGPTFPLWHREYNKRLEIALRSVDSSVCVPYWDSTLDQRLPNPSHSIMWTELFMGSTDSNNFVNSGFLANWITSDGNRVSRTMGANGGQLINETEANNVMSIQELNHIFAFVGGSPDKNCATNSSPRETVLEFIHNNVHVWLGGDMAELPTSPQDPIFFLHHSFTDYLWEQWRLRYQDRTQRETQFTPDDQIVPCSGSENYHLNATMLPFTNPNVTNRVGLSNNYTDFLYNYEPRPSCQYAGGCKSAYLFCDTTLQRYADPICCAKIRPGGDCSFFVRNKEESCYNATCVQGICQQQKQQQKQNVQQLDRLGTQIVLRSAIDEVGTVTLTPYIWAAVDTTPSPTPSPPTERECYDNDVCCIQWAANGTCKTAPRYMNTWCQGSCRFDGCRPYADYGKPGCNDIHSQCARWALFSDGGHNECDQNPRWMECNCAKSCNKCGATTAEQCAARTPTDYKMPKYGSGTTPQSQSDDAISTTFLPDGFS
ncbi:hypothetical protein niasHT_018259 [Heterodera trifolii]|uniref:ShKT domain-containing protein n=1 Tax=Heterodera trifolii TaxID=157864 RepID=A0ABD2L5J6_9BILA